MLIFVPYEGFVMLLRLKPGTKRLVGALRCDCKVDVTSGGHKARAFLLMSQRKCDKQEDIPEDFILGSFQQHPFRKSGVPNPMVEMPWSVTKVM